MLVVLQNHLALWLLLVCSCVLCFCFGLHSFVRRSLLYGLRRSAGTLLLAHALLSCGKLVRVHLLRMLLQWTFTFGMLE
jgi:hypothetical protein